MHNPNYIAPLVLSIRSGRPVLIRNVMPDDKHYFRKGIKRLSVQSLYHRFHCHSFSLTEQHLNYLAHVDHYDHMAVGVLDMGSEQASGVALGR